MTIVGIDHIQLAAPAGCEAEARRFYGDLLGLTELPKPPALAGRGGVWFALGAGPAGPAPDQPGPPAGQPGPSGGQQLHIGVADPHVPAVKAHPGLAVPAAQLDALADRLRAAGVAVDLDDGLTIPGVRRFHAHDPFGNRLEFVGV